MNFGFSYIGLIFLLMLMIPNIIMIFSENIDLPDDFIDVTLSLLDNNKRTIKIKDLCYIPNKENYKDNIIIISETNNGIEKKICALKNI